MTRTLPATPPIAIRSASTVGARFAQRMRAQLAHHIASAGFVERATVRLEDSNGPKGGVDSVCRIKLVLARRPSLQVEKRAGTFDVAFAHAVHAIGTALRRARGKYGLHGGRRRPAPPRPAKHATETARDPGELIGRRVGRGPDAKARAVMRPEKLDRAFYVDTAAPARSASDRRAGGDTTVRRNARLRHPSATASLEDSRTRPSRKSSRRSANRAKSAQTKARAVAAAISRPSARATRRG